MLYVLLTLDIKNEKLDGPRDYHTKWGKSEGERQISWYHLYVESKIWYKWTYLTKQKQTHRHRKQTYGYQRGRERWERDKLGVWD